MSFNSQDHKIGFKCLDAFLRVIGKAFKSSEMQNKRHDATFAYLLKTFTDILKSKNSNWKESTLAIQVRSTRFAFNNMRISTVSPRYMPIFIGPQCLIKVEMFRRLTLILDLF